MTPNLPARVEYCPVDATSAQDGVALNTETFKHAFYTNLFYVQGKIPTLATRHDYYLALALTVRDQMLHRWISTAEAYTKHGSRTVAYFSAEFLMGPHLGNNILNLGLESVARQALTEQGLDYEEVVHQRSFERALFKELDLPFPNWMGIEMGNTEIAQEAAQDIAKRPQPQ